MSLPGPWRCPHSWQSWATWPAGRPVGGALPAQSGAGPLSATWLSLALWMGCLTLPGKRQPRFYAYLSEVGLGGVLWDRSLLRGSCEARPLPCSPGLGPQAPAYPPSLPPHPSLEVLCLPAPPSCSWPLAPHLLKAAEVRWGWRRDWWVISESPLMGIEVLSRYFTGCLCLKVQVNIDLECSFQPENPEYI